MGNIKKIARPLNKAKNEFLDWLKKNNAECLDIFEGEKSEEWDYYRVVSGFVGGNLYTVSFEMWKGSIRIDYCDEEYKYPNMGIQEFLELLS